MSNKGFWAPAALVWACTAWGQPQFVVGVCTHFQQSKGILNSNLAMIRQAGVQSIRDEVTWSGVERTKDQFVIPEPWVAYVHRAVENGLEPLLILDYGNRFYDGGNKPISDEAVEGFARYAEFIVNQFKGKVRLYEVWNEWDIGIGGTTPGTAETYTRLLKAVYPRMKAIDPGLTVMGGGMTSGGIRKGWLEQMLQAGALQALDAVSIHTYNYSSPGRGRTPEAWADFVAQAQATIQKHSGGKDVPLYVTEMGWPTHQAANGTPPAQSAAYLARMFLLARTLPYLKGIWWYDFQDDGWRAAYNEHNFGTVRPDLTPKPSYFALSDVAKIAGEAEFVERFDVGDPDLWALRFRLQDGRDVLALWSAHAEDEWKCHLTASGSDPQPVWIGEIGRGGTQREWGTRDWAADSRAALIPNELTVVVREMPWVVLGELSGVTVRFTRVAAAP